MKKLITEIENKSIASELGICPGDFLLSINSQEIVDVFDYRMLQFEEELTIEIEREDGEIWQLEIEKDAYDDLGLIFEAGLMDNMRNCGNNCIFCFIDQAPPNMRPTLYVKDDDYRLSFLHGNYITLTNMTERDIDRIVKHRISPVNISIHTTDPDLRVAMMGNKRAGRSLEFLGKLAQAGIVLSLQIVLCKGYNDGVQLEKTIEDLSKYLPEDGGGCSLCIVPVGMTKYRDGLTPLKPLTTDDCKQVIDTTNKWQSIFLEKFGTRFVFCADEFYLRAGIDFPDYDDYEDFPQIDNGVGMAQAFKTEFEEAVEDDELRVTSEVSLVTGVAAGAFFRELLRDYPQAIVHEVVNDFYGDMITVAGLLTGQDIIKQLQGKKLGSQLLIPKNCLRDDDDVFLDDVTLNELSNKLGAKVMAVEPEADALVEALKRLSQKD